jgi:hypothetical protein
VLSRPEWCLQCAAYGILTRGGLPVEWCCLAVPLTWGFGDLGATGSVLSVQSRHDPADYVAGRQTSELELHNSCSPHTINMPVYKPWMKGVLPPIHASSLLLLVCNTQSGLRM